MYIIQRMSDSESSDSDNDIFSNESIHNVDGAEISPSKFFEKKELCYYTMADRFFKTSCSKDDIKLMVNIINAESDISLRVLDWFAAKYSKKRNKVNIPGDGTEEFDVRISYDAQLRTYRKKYFDPFRRRNKFYYKYDKDDPKKKIKTTIGQLNFFKWVIDKKILEYIKNNLDDINKEMKTSTSEEKEEKKKKKSTKKSKGKKKSGKDKSEVQVKVKKIEEDDDAAIVLYF